MILCLVLSFDDSKVQRRAVSLCWRHLIEARFPSYRRYDPPKGGLGFVELEEDLQLNKLIYSATLRLGNNNVRSSSAASNTEEQQPATTDLTLQGRFAARRSKLSTVAFLNWVPSYYRSNANDDRNEVVHEIEESDAIALWILVTKLLCRDMSQGGNDEGLMRADTVTEGHASGLHASGETCIACSGAGCRLCAGTGLRVGVGPGLASHAWSKKDVHGFLRVRCGGSGDASFQNDDAISGQNGGELILAGKHPLSSEEVRQLQALLDHRRNDKLLRCERTRASIVPFGGVSNV
eukprot:CAMPEP_0172759000 /NCGR_PEP_ID=MMETSP1074-20121228/166833_1 /TAXON_ID=2916 /ORGANISM="Ceratium fusus, Strain PA161109" /LENGTH=292 /DNA_ID=CAMNT_0013592691 /DNA_START=127 /DNA_END=1005 /DNA_ORIENTATION=-